MPVKNNEPAAAATATSSTKENYCLDNDSTLLGICQAELKDIREALLMPYESMTEQEQKAFDLGEAYGRMGNLLNLLERSEGV